jgi:hypothetical protein
LEEYYIGGLYLGIFNGVTDGSVLIISVYLYCAICGNSLFINEATISGLSEEEFNLTIAEIVVITITIL